MAVTSIWSIKGRIDKVINYAINPEKTIDRNPRFLSSFHTIDNVLEYTTDEMKTEKKIYVTGVNCDADYAKEQFKLSKSRWQKKGDIVAFHGYQSFKENEVTAEQAHSIGVKLAQNLWGDKFEIVVATHLNTGHYHNHFVLNSVSFNTGEKYLGQLYTYIKMREESDKLCREYGLSVIEKHSGKSKSYSEWQAKKEGKTTKRDAIRNDIDRAVTASYNEAEFVKLMTEMGYEFKTRGEDGKRLKYPALRPLGAKGYFRFHKLGEEYELDRVLQRVQDNWLKKEPFPDLYKPVTIHKGKFNGKYESSKKHTSLFITYTRYRYELIRIKKYPTSVKRVSFLLREDVLKLDKFDQQTRLLAKNKIQTLDDLQKYKADRENKIQQLTDTRKDLYNVKRRAERR